MEGTEKITILNTSILRREIYKTKDGDLVSRPLPCRKSFARQKNRDPSADVFELTIESPKDFDEDRAKNSIKTKVNNITFQDDDFTRA